MIYFSYTQQRRQTEVKSWIEYIYRIIIMMNYSIYARYFNRDSMLTLLKYLAVGEVSEI